MDKKKKLEEELKKIVETEALNYSLKQAIYLTEQEIKYIRIFIILALGGILNLYGDFFDDISKKIVKIGQLFEINEIFAILLVVFFYISAQLMAYKVLLMSKTFKNLMAKIFEKY